jgi:hypothetical protein
MHPYATDSNETKAIPLYLAALSVVAAYLLHVILEKYKLAVPWWIDAPSVIGFYGLFYIVFNNWLWRTSLVRKIGLVKLPDLNGTWTGYIASSFDEHAGRHNGQLLINQTWTRISITLKTDNSQSHSLIGGIITQNAAANVLDYEYSNEPRSHAVATMHAHRGTARLILNKNNDLWILEGDYYTGRDRQNYGTLHMERPSEV